MKQTIITLVLIVGLGIWVFLVQKTQETRSRASLEISQTFTVSTDDAETEPVTCAQTSCTTDKESVHIRFKDQNAQDLLNSLP